MVAGCVKPDGSGGWQVLNDGTHVPLGGLTVLQVTSTAIKVGFSQVDEIHTFVVVPDETLAKLHYTAGASVGLDNAVIWLANDDGQVNPTTVVNTSANLWIYGLFSIEEAE